MKDELFRNDSALRRAERKAAEVDRLKATFHRVRRSTVVRIGLLATLFYAVVWAGAAP